MNKAKSVFAQLVEFLDKDKFCHLVDKYGGNRYVKIFTCWNQLLALMFGQLSNRESLMDLVVALEAHRSKCYPHYESCSKRMNSIMSRNDFVPSFRGFLISFLLVPNLTGH